MIIVDSSVWIDYFNGRIDHRTDKLDALLATSQLSIGDLMLTEVLQGFTSDKEFLLAKELLMTLPVIPILNHEIAIKSAENYRVLRKKGITIRNTIDMLIATFCLENDHELLHHDRDFDQIAQGLGLRVV